VARWQLAVEAGDLVAAAARERPLLVVLDDLPDADTSSVRLLRRRRGRGRAGPIVVGRRARVADRFVAQQRLMQFAQLGTGFEAELVGQVSAARPYTARASTVRPAPAAHDHDRSCPTPRPFPDRNPFLSPVRRHDEPRVVLQLRRAASLA